MVKKFLLIVFVLYFSLLVFMPKEELYYTLEEALAKQDIKINEKSIEEGMFSLRVKEADIYIKGIQLAKVEKLEFFTLLFYTRVKIQKLRLDDSLKAMAPTSLETVTFSHLLWSPTELEVKVKASFEANGTVDLNERSIYLDVNGSKDLEQFQKSLRKSEKGWVYETSF